jgi:electron transfer flavoprotein alpha/beta subunit
MAASVAVVSSGGPAPAALEAAAALGAGADEAACVWAQL